MLLEKQALSKLNQQFSIGVVADLQADHMLFAWAGMNSHRLSAYALCKRHLLN
jgi:hypothetical protein